MPTGPIVTAIFGLQLTLAGLVFAATGGGQAGAFCAGLGILLEIVALGQIREPRTPPSA
jgi:hypothetical protein